MSENSPRYLDPASTSSASLRALLLGALLAVVACSSDPSSNEEAGTGGESPGTGGAGLGGAGHDGTGGASLGSGGTKDGTGGEAQASGGSVGTGGGASELDPAEPSSGCGEASTDQTGSWLPQSVDSRYYDVQLPNGYDASNAYPVVYQFHGCNSNENRENNNVPVVNSSGDAAIIVRGRALGDCWNNGDDDDYTAAMMIDVESRWCVDTARRLLSGYSSGAYYSHHLSCVRGDEFRAAATIAGGGGGNNCQGQVASLLIHDANDPTVSISQGVTARDRYLSQNGCNVAAATTPGDHVPCQVYAECDEGLPVVWCETQDQGHSRQDSLSGPASWDFFESLL